jgi:hypothetical protein
MIKNFFGVVVLVALSVLCHGCKEPAPGEPGGNGGPGGGGTPATTATLTGVVKDSRPPFPPVSGATVALFVPSKGISRLDTTEIDGSYTMVVNLGDTLPTSGTLTASRSGYFPTSVQVNLQPGATTQAPEITIDRDTTIIITGGGAANSIALIGSTLSQLSVRGVGGNETAYITFEARDSLGFPITIANQDTITFTVTPLGGAYMSPQSVLTNASGLASTTINSGTVSGTLQLVARLRRDSDGVILQSEPVRIIVHGGLPDQNHFSVATSRFNLPGLAFVGRTATITVLAGDRYSNPVVPNTAVYFSTTIGVAATNQGFTNENGFATGTLYTGNPLGVNGFGYVKATTFGEGGVVVTDSVRMLFSGSPRITYGGPSTFTIGPGGCGSFTFTVADVNGNPITGGSTVSLQVQTATAYTVDEPIVVPDVQDPGPGITIFTFSVCDVLEEPPEGGSATVKIRVTWEGNTYVQTIASGTIGL